MNVKPLEFDTFIRVRVSQATKDALATLRDGTGLSESEHVRQVLDDYIKIEMLHRARR